MRLAATALAAALDAWAPAARAEGPPNIVFIDICSARADRFGSYGYGKGVTPRMDAFAREGAVFENAMAQSSWCLPNFATLFTGQPPEVHGLYSLAFRKLPEAQITLAQRLKEAGYDTAAYSGGTWLLPQLGLDKGFDHYVNTLTTAAKLTSLAERKPAMLAWIDGRGKHPFFLYVSIEDIHYPYLPEFQYSLVSELDPAEVSLESEASSVPLLREGGGVPSGGGSPAPIPPRTAPRSGPIPEKEAKYDAALSKADRQVGLFLDDLKARGLWDNTVVIITGDHGDSLGEHGILGHMEGLYQSTIHVPLLLRHPRVPGPGGRRVSELIERVDLAPTVLDIAGAPYADLELPGRSLLSLLRGPATPWREYAFASSKHSTEPAADLILDQRVVRDKRWKLHWYLQKGRFELYDLAADPREEFDLSARRPEVVSRLAFELLKNLELSRPHAAGPSSGKTPARPARLLPTPPAD
ncbi:MAG: sulfatase [Elusimicrobiota bacterium]